MPDEFTPKFTPGIRVSILAGEDRGQEGYVRRVNPTRPYRMHYLVEVATGGRSWYRAEDLEAV